ncbi:thiol peroxidase [Fulvivirga sp. M361]|uniref:thiol peroxidase n=1 Tax=Fulvivirga sp. M361 TaxID=2594266 RepID=UPI00117A50E8|nr:thiol peroxidase [Fulvivirga sp. M361]TRX58638.1 thiol peroxidase [Fulvivirga sp. M361]
MAQVTLKGNPSQTNGDLPEVGTSLDFTLTKSDLSEVSLSDFKGRKLVLNIFPSIDTSTCATSVRTFNKEAASLDNTKVLCISKDLPFAHARFCGAEGIEDVISLSDFRHPEFSEKLGIRLEDGPLAGLDARSVIVLDEEGKVLYTQLVNEIVDEPDYEAALKSL